MYSKILSRPLLALITIVSVVAAANTTATVQTAALTATLENVAPTASAQLFSIKPTQWLLTPDSVPKNGTRLNQKETNGNSFLGSLAAPQFAKFIGDLSGPVPWGDRTAKKTNPYKDSPDTGVVRHYDWTLARSTLAPDGVERPVILINGEFPGPTIQANWGDTIEVTVHNNVDDEGTSLHWHGFLQGFTNYEDGVPGITQCPIAPGESFTYSFKASLYGTSWYHSHFSAQYVAGTFGAIVVHGPTDNAQYDIDLGPVLLTGTYHRGYYDILKDVMGTDASKIIPSSDNNLINGKGIMNCSFAAEGETCTPDAALSKFAFQPGKTHRLRLINAGAEAVQKFSIDNHKLKVIAYDFVPIEPYETTIVTLGVGQRADVLVTADDTWTTSFWMRSKLTCASANQPNGLGIVTYNATSTVKRANSTTTASNSTLPTTTAWPDNTDACANDDLSSTVPYYPISPPSTPAITTELNITVGQNTSGHFLFSMNKSPFRVDYNEPILQGIESGKMVTDFPVERNIYNFSSASSIRLVVNNQTPAGHPMHIHGHNMYVLSSTASSSWDGSIVNADNPSRRDTQLLVPNGNMVIQIDADNPGVWPFHCHIAWHVSAGLYVNILERPDDIIKSVQSPQNVKDTCDSWSAWTSSHFVDQIDSGLRIKEREEAERVRRSTGRRV